MTTITTELPLPHVASPKGLRITRQGLISASFAFFNTLRIVGYLPTLLAIQASGQSDQHSLFTWAVFFGANTSMALWLHEQNGHRINRAVVANAFNALMCACIAVCIAWIRWMPN